MKDFTEHWQEEKQKQQNDVLQLAEAWSAEEPEWVAERITVIENAARGAEIHAMWYWTGYLCSEINRRAVSSLAWVRAFLKPGIHSGLLLPFLASAVAKSEAGWEDVHQ